MEVAAVRGVTVGTEDQKSNRLSVGGTGEEKLNVDGLKENASEGEAGKKLIKKASSAVVEKWKNIKEQEKGKQQAILMEKQKSKLHVQELLVAREKERAALNDGVENSAQDEQVKAVETKASPEGKTKGAGESGSEEEEAAAAQKGQRAWAVAQLEQSKARRNSKDKKSTNVAAEAKVVQSANVGAKEAEEVDEEAAAQIAARQRKWALSQLGFDGPPKSPTVGKEERERGSEAGGEDECMDEETAAQKAARQRKWAVAQLGFEIKGGEGKKEEKKEVEAERQRKWAMAQLGYQDSRKDGKEGGEGVKVERQKTLSIARQLEEKQSIRTKRVMNDKKREEALQRVARQKALEIVKMLEETAKKNKKREGAGEEERGGGETEEAQTAGGRSALAIAKWLEETSKRGKQKRQNQSPVGGTKSTEKVAERAAYFHAVLSGQKPVELQEEGAVVEEDDGTLNLRKTPKFEPVVESEKREMDGEGREGSTERTVPLEASQEKVENVVVGVGGQPEEETEGEKEEKIERVEYDEKEEHKDEDVAMIELAVEKAVEQMLESGDWQIVDKREVENTHIRSTPTWAVGTGEVGYGKLGKTEGREGEWKVETQEELQKQVEAAILSAERASATKAKSAQGGKLSSSLSGLTFFNPPSPQTFPGISMRKTRTPTSATRSEKGEEGEEDDEDDELNLTEVVQAITQNLTSIFQKWSPYKTTSGSGSTDALPIIDF